MTAEALTVELTVNGYRVYRHSSPYGNAPGEHQIVWPMAEVIDTLGHVPMLTDMLVTRITIGGAPASRQWRRTCYLHWPLPRPRVPWPFGMRAGAARKHISWHHTCSLPDGHFGPHHCDDCAGTTP